MKAGMRDASWYASPGTAARYHIDIDGVAACQWNMLLVRESLQEASEVPEHLRCQHPACKKYWEINDTESEHRKSPTTAKESLKENSQ